MENVVTKNEMEIVYKKPKTITDTPMHYCPGCGHGVVHKILMEVIDELGIQDQTIGIAPVGCAVFAYDYMNIDMQEAAHGRASAVATGVRRVLPDKYVFSYQGDGDLAAIGTGETIHTVNRGENILMLFINNGIYGMTGGQMAPTSHRYEDHDIAVRPRCCTGGKSDKNYGAYRTASRRVLCNASGGTHDAGGSQIKKSNRNVVQVSKRKKGDMLY